jgi:deazaflavin-dependent oxidoreductase (nitroreductase family)
VSENLSQEELKQVTDVQSYNEGVIAAFRYLRHQNLLLLTTTGAKSGQKRTTPLLYEPFEDSIYILGSFRGAPKHPSWVFNLRANPIAGVEVGTDSYDAEAVELQGDERDRVFDAIAKQQPLFEELRASTPRTIPVFDLRRR